MTDRLPARAGATTRGVRVSKNQRAVAALAVGAIGATALAMAPLTAAYAESVSVRINEIESSGGVPGDWIELTNTGSEQIDLSGFQVKDSDDDHVYTVADGTTVDPGAFLVLDEAQTDTPAALEFDFGLGGNDTVRLFDTAGALVDEHAWTAHASVTLGVNDAGVWGETSAPTKGAANVFASVEEPGVQSDLRLNEVDSSPSDWVELVNVGDAVISLDGVELRDDSDDHSWRFPADASIAPGEFVVVDEQSLGLVDGTEASFTSAIGIGSADRIRLFDAVGTQLDDTGLWNGHAMIGNDAQLATLARCIDGVGDFMLAHPTLGATNVCVDPQEGGTEPPAPIETVTWPGAAAVRTVDMAPMFLEDSSGLDTQLTDDGVVLWAVDNGTGTFWKLDAQADGSATFAEGWADGKRARFQKDAETPAAAGPDTEGITVAGDGMLYLASERDNGAKAVNFNTVLRVDPEAPGPDVVADQEWDLTALLPAVSANLGIEAVEWVADTDLAGLLFDDATGAPYDPGAYPGHGDGLFFVALEDGGRVFAFALNADGSAQQVAEIENDLAGVMALDYDTVLGGLWAVCDNGCAGASVFITLNGTADPELTYTARPEGLPDVNNEGFATSPMPGASAGAGAGAGVPAIAGSGSPVVPAVASDGAAATMAAADVDADGTERAVWWFEDGVTSGALRAGGLAAAVQDPGQGDADADSAAGGASAADAAGTASAAGAASGAGTAAGTSAAGAGGAAGGEPANASSTAQGSSSLVQTGGDSSGFLLLIVGLLAVMGFAVLGASRLQRGRVAVAGPAEPGAAHDGIPSA